MTDAPAVLLVAHGSRDPRAAEVVRRVQAEVSALEPDRAVSVAYLDFTSPSVGEALRALTVGGVREIVVVPLLFAPGYHVRVDLPSAIAEVRAGHPDLRVTIADALGATPREAGADRLVAALDARLAEAVGVDAAPDAVVLASAGSSDPAARTAVEEVAARWAALRGVPVHSAYATACGPTVSESVADLRRRGFERVAVGGLFVAPGRLPEASARAAREAGASAVAGPLGVHPELVRLILGRVCAHEGLLAPVR